MPIVQTSKPELEYNTETGQFIFNGGRNITPNLKKHDPLPMRISSALPYDEPEE